MRADRSTWTLPRMNDLLALAGADKRGLVEKEDLEAACERCLADVAEGRFRAPAPFLKSRYGGEEAAKPPPATPKGRPRLCAAP